MFQNNIQIIFCLLNLLLENDIHIFFVCSICFFKSLDENKKIKSICNYILITKHI
jgi:hypothetical protein